MSEWLSLPNFHPAVVHFPIALLPTALLIDLAAIIHRHLRKGTDTGIDWLARAASLLYVVAAAAAFAALKTGEQAADSFPDLPAIMHPRISAHSDAAHWAASMLAAVAVLHLGVRLLEHWTRSDVARGALVLLALANVVLISRAADLGGALVYRHGLGVSLDAEGNEVAPEITTATPQEPAAPLESAAGDLFTEARGRFHAGGQGPGLDWRPQPEDGAVLYRLLEVATGFSRDAASWVQGRPGRAEENGAGLSLQIADATLLLLPGEFGDVQIEADLDLRGFSGTVGLAHHVVGSRQRGVFALSTSGEASLVDLRDGAWTVLDEEPASVPGARVGLAVSSTGRHLKGLVDGITVVHGHISTPGEGRCGLFVEGEGSVRILAVRVIPL